MAKEIERKFLVKPSWQPKDTGSKVRQGYLVARDNLVVRVGTKRSNIGYITVKSGSSKGSISRDEFEYNIDTSDANYMLDNMCEGVIIEKTRYFEWYKSNTWEIDVFHKDNDGLIVAEIELLNENESFEKPEWVGEEVSYEDKYSNHSLSKNPFKEWK